MSAAELDVMDDGEPVGDEGVIRVLDSQAGDKRIKWKPGDTASIERAREKFAELKAKGYAIFALKRVRLTKFPKPNGADLIATKDSATIARLEDEVPATPANPSGPVKTFEPDDQRELTAVPPRRGG